MNPTRKYVKTLQVMFMAEEARQTQSDEEEYQRQSRMSVVEELIVGFEEQLTEERRLTKNARRGVAKPGQ